MIGVYNYTVWLTYGSMLSAWIGIGLALGGNHIYGAMYCLLLCGIFDSFDGRVARTKKDRTDLEKNFGIQIDSLTDIVAFGVLPAAIGLALMNQSEVCSNNPLIKTIGYILLSALVLSGLIRLAYFNVVEEERQKTEGGGVAHFYTGMPITSSCVGFPTVLMVGHIVGGDCTIAYLLVTALAAFLFISKIQVRKPGLRGIIIFMAILLAELIAFLLV